MKRIEALAAEMVAEATAAIRQAQYDADKWRTRCVTGDVAMANTLREVSGALAKTYPAPFTDAHAARALTAALRGIQERLAAYLKSDDEYERYKARVCADNAPKANPQ